MSIVIVHNGQAEVVSEDLHDVHLRIGDTEFVLGDVAEPGGRSLHEALIEQRAKLYVELDKVPSGRSMTTEQGQMLRQVMVLNELISQCTIKGDACLLDADDESTPQ